MAANSARASGLIKGEQVLDELGSLMDLSAEEQALLAELAPHARAIAPAMSQTFYERLLQHPQTIEYFEGRSMDSLHGTIQQWFVELFSGTYDIEYARRRLRIGHVHVHIGLPVRYPLAMLDVVMPYGADVTQQSSQPDLGPPRLSQSARIRRCNLQPGV
jgi:hypothetical protein